MSVRRPESQGHMEVQAYKLVLLGESAVGKSSLAIRFVKGQFTDYQESTIGAAFLTQTVTVGDSVIKFEIWDTAGQERYQSLAPMYYRGSHLALVVYDITSHDSHVRARAWVDELKKQASPNIIVALVGNKQDLESKREVMAETAQTYATDNGLLFFETSAKTATGVQELFATLAKKLPTTSPETRPTGLALDSNSLETKKCC